MPCPNCAAATEEGALECVACGVVFEKWARRAQNVAAAPPAAAPEAPAEPVVQGVDAGKAVPALGCAAAAALFGWFALSAPSGQTVPPSAVTLPGGFALKVPDGWQATPADCSGASADCTAATITKAADPAAAVAEASGGFPIGLSATVFPDGPRAGSAPDDAVDSAYLAGWRTQLDRSSPGPREVVVVDGVRALLVSASGPKHVREEVRKPVIMKEAQAVAELRRRNPNQSVITYQASFSGKKGDFIPDVVVDPGEYREADYQVALKALLISARGYTLLLSCRAQEEQRADCEQALGEFRRGLRVVDRPRRLDLWTKSPVKARR